VWIASCAVSSNPDHFAGISELHYKSRVRPCQAIPTNLQEINHPSISFQKKNDEGTPFAANSIDLNYRFFSAL